MPPESNPSLKYSGRVSRVLVLASALAGALSNHCTDSQNPGGREEAKGSIAVRLSLPDGDALSELEYRITGHGVVLSARVPLGNSTRVSFQVGGIPVGEGYSIEITGTTSDGASCAGTSLFDVVAGTVGLVVVPLSCGDGSATTGDVEVEVEVARCARIRGISALPLEVVVGGTVSLSATASLPSASFTWSASAGRIERPNSAKTTYSCTEAGEHEVTLSARGGGAECVDTRSLTLSCSASGEPTPADCESELAELDRLACYVRAYGITRREQLPYRPDLADIGGQIMSGISLRTEGITSWTCNICHSGLSGASNGVLAQSLLQPAPSTLTGIHRNPQGLTNTGRVGHKALFWDGRVWEDEQGNFNTPAGDSLPPGLDSILAAQVLIPMLSRIEMFGYAPGTNFGRAESPRGLIDPEADPIAAWSFIMDRYRAWNSDTFGHPDAGIIDRLQAVYPGEEVGIQHVANAMAARIIRDFNTPNPTPEAFEGYLAGRVLPTSRSLRGALLFFGRAGCVRCHSGPLLSDGKFHNLAVPQIGPGFASGLPGAVDYGRYDVSHDEADRYAFLTPSLWDVRSTYPYMHNGVFATLEDVVRHHLDPEASAKSFECASLPNDLGFSGRPVSRSSVPCHEYATNPELYDDMIGRVDPLLPAPLALAGDEIAELVAFLDELRDR